MPSIGPETSIARSRRVPGVCHRGLARHGLELHVIGSAAPSCDRPLTMWQGSDDRSAAWLTCVALADVHSTPLRQVRR